MCHEPLHVVMPGENTLPCRMEPAEIRSSRSQVVVILDATERISQKRIQPFQYESHAAKKSRGFRTLPVPNEKR